MGDMRVTDFEHAPPGRKRGSHWHIGLSWTVGKRFFAHLRGRRLTLVSQRLDGVFICGFIRGVESENQPNDR